MQNCLYTEWYLTTKKCKGIGYERRLWSRREMKYIIEREDWTLNWQEWSGELRKLKDLPQLFLLKIAYLKTCCICYKGWFINMSYRKGILKNFLAMVLAYIAGAAMSKDLLCSNYLGYKTSIWCSKKHLQNLSSSMDFSSFLFLFFAPKVSPGQLTKKYSSCSTIFIDDSTVSQPNLRSTIKW